MPVPILVAATILAALVLLIVLYRRARYSPLFGDSLAFPMIFVARILVKPQGMLEKAAHYSNGVVEKSLRYPPGVTVTDDAWQGVAVIARIILFVVCSIVLTGDVYGMLQRLPLLFGGAGTVSLPGSFVIPSALLFICMSALYGAVVLECAGLLPTGAHLFPNMTDKARKWLGILCAIGFALSLIFAVLFWVFSALYITVDPDTAGVLAIPIFALVGIILTGASVLSLWGLCVGFLGMISLVFWLLYCGLHTVAGVVSVVPSLIDVFVQHMTQGRLSVYGDLLGHDPYKVPASPFPASRRSITSQTDILALPELAATIDSVREVVPIETTELEETTTMNPDKNAFIGFVGEFGSHEFPHVAQAIDKLRATESILTSYFLERALTHVQTSIAGIGDLSHANPEKSLSMLHGATEDEGDHTLLCDLGHKLAEAYHHLIAIPAPFAHFIDCRKLVNSIDLLESNKRRLPLISQVVVTSVSELDMQNKGVQTGIADLVALQQEGFIDSVIVLDPRSPFAYSYGEETQLRFLAQMILSLIIAHKHDPHNTSFSSVFGQFSSLSPFTTVSFASQVVAVGNMPKRWSWLPLSTGSSGTGYYADILSQVREATDRVLLEEDTHSFPAQVRSDVGCMVLYNIPIELRDPRFSACVRDNSLYVSSHYPFASSITVRGNGCSYPHQLGGRFLVQASCLYPLQPAIFPKLQGVRNVKVTPLYPTSTQVETVNGNGNVPTQKQTRKPKATKVSPTRQKQATGSTRRVVRRNTKQAK